MICWKLKAVNHISTLLLLFLQINEVKCDSETESLEEKIGFVWAFFKFLNSRSMVISRLYNISKWVMKYFNTNEVTRHNSNIMCI